MSENFQVHSLFRDYEVRFEDDFAARLAMHLREGDVVIVDANVRRLYGHRLDRFLAESKHIINDATEEQKSYVQLEWILQSLIENGFKKSHRLIAIGGGITQDVTGFIEVSATAPGGRPPRE